LRQEGSIQGHILLRSGGAVSGQTAPQKRHPLHHITIFDHAVRGEFDLAHRLDEDLLRLSRQCNDSAGLVLGHISFGRNLYMAGRFASSRSHLEAGLALYDPISHRSLAHQVGISPCVSLHGWLGCVLVCLGFSEQALAQKQRSDR
jgi:hypothetical protein